MSVLFYSLITVLFASYFRNIKRIVFSTLLKYDGTRTVQLTASQVKQIAGRAGRYGSDHPEGEATT